MVPGGHRLVADRRFAVADRGADRCRGLFSRPQPNTLRPWRSDRGPRVGDRDLVGDEDLENNGNDLVRVQGIGHAGP